MLTIVIKSFPLLDTPDVIFALSISNVNSFSLFRAPKLDSFEKHDTIWFNYNPKLDTIKLKTKQTQLYLSIDYLV